LQQPDQFNVWASSHPAYFQPFNVGESLLATFRYCL
jgi:hypothetical protein